MDSVSVAATTIPGGTRRDTSGAPIAARNISIAGGPIHSPASTGGSPSTSWSCWVISSMEPPTPTRPISRTLSAALKVRLVNRRMSSSGLASLPWRLTNTTANTTPTTVAATVARPRPSLANCFTA